MNQLQEELELVKRSFAQYQERQRHAHQQFIDKLRGSLDDRHVDPQFLDPLLQEHLIESTEFLSFEVHCAPSSFLAAWEEAGSILSRLKRDAKGVASELIEVTEKQYLAHHAITLRQANELQVWIGGDDVTALLQCFDRLDLLSTRRDTTTLRLLFRDLMTSESVPSATFPLILHTIERNLSSGTRLTRSQYRLLGENLEENRQTLLDLVESKLLALDMLPIDAYATDVIASGEAAVLDGNISVTSIKTKESFTPSDSMEPTDTIPTNAVGDNSCELPIAPETITCTHQTEVEEWLTVKRMSPQAFIAFLVKGQLEIKENGETVTMRKSTSKWSKPVVLQSIAFAFYGRLKEIIARCNDNSFILNSTVRLQVVAFINTLHDVANADGRIAATLIKDIDNIKLTISMVDNGRHWL